LKLLADGCLSPATVRRLRAAGHDVAWAGEWPKDPGDPRVLAIANREGRVLLTADRGFGALAMSERQQHAGIIVIVKTLAVRHAELIARVLALHGEDLQKGALIIASLERIRVRWPKASA